MTSRDANVNRRIFVSYSRQDKEIVDREIESLERLGYPLWYDRRDIHAGIPWSPELEQTIDACACLLVFATHNSAGSEWVVREITRSLAQHKPVVIVYWEDVAFPAEINDRLKEIQGIPRYSLHRPEYERVLTGSLSRHCPPVIPPPGDMRSRDFVNAELVEPVNSQWVVSPLLIFFLLMMGAVASCLFALSFFMWPSFGEPGGPLDNGPLAYLMGSLLFVFGVGMSVVAFGFYWIYVRKGSA